MERSMVAVVQTSPESILEDIHRALEMADVGRWLKAEREILLKLNLSWTK